MNFLKLMKSILFVVTLICASAGHADSDFDNDPGFSRNDLLAALQKNGLDPQSAENMVTLLQKQFGRNPDQNIPIQGYMFAKGFNAAFILDHDTWMFDATILDSRTGQVVTIPKLFLVDFNNKGIKAELTYKFMFTFIPSGVDIKRLNGAQFGGGLGILIETIMGLEFAFMQGLNVNGTLLHAAFKIGGGGGITFPSMNFKMRNISNSESYAPLLGPN